MVLNLFLVLLNLKEVFLLLLFALEIVDFPLYLIFEHFLGLVDILADLFLQLATLHLADGLLFLLLALSFCSLSCDFHVSLARLEDIRSALFGLVEFLPCLIEKYRGKNCSLTVTKNLAKFFRTLLKSTYLLLLLLKKGNAIRKKLVVFLSLLTGDLSCD